MTYLMGCYYVWRSNGGIHIWSADGYDSWDISGWATDYDEQSGETFRKVGMEDASGIGIPIEIFDKLVLMRFAEMLEEGSISATINSLLENEAKIPNFGTDAFNRQHEFLRKMTEYYTENKESPGIE